MLCDDVAFIHEVHAGETDAPDMDPAMELAQLKRKFEQWKKEFRVRVCVFKCVRVCVCVFVCECVLIIETSGKKTMECEAQVLSSERRS